MMMSAHYDVCNSSCSQIENPASDKIKNRLMKLKTLRVNHGPSAMMGRRRKLLASLGKRVFRMPETQDLSMLPVGWVLTLILIVLVLCIWAIAKVTEANQHRARTPREKLIGELGRVLSPISATRRGKVKVFGETWDAQAVESESPNDSPELLHPKEEVRIVGFDAVDSQVLLVSRLQR